MRIMMAVLAMAIAGPAMAQDQAALVGQYDGHQMEMGAQLSLTADGRFEYGLVYGALDESGRGTWTAKNHQVLLTSDPVKPPRFVVTGQKPAARAMVTVTLETPKGLSAQYFDVVLVSTKGQVNNQQLSDEGLSLPLDPADPPASVQLLLPIFELASDPIRIDPAKGYALSLRFEPNDIGKADFRETALTIDKGDLVLERFGRTIRFNKVE